MNRKKDRGARHGLFGKESSVVVTAPQAAGEFFVAVLAAGGEAAIEAGVAASSES